MGRAHAQQAADPRPRVVHADLRRATYVRWRRFLAESDRWTAAEIARYQLTALRAAVRHANARTAGYRELYRAAGVGPETVRSLDDVRRLPPVDKARIRDALEAFSAPGSTRRYVTTAGSTGVPFGFYRDRQALAKELASKAHQYARRGWREGDRQLVLRGLPIGTASRMRLVRRFQELRCSAYHLQPAWMDAYVRRAHAYRPVWLRCYPSAGWLLARHLDRTGQRLPPLRGVLCASENLYDFQKHDMERVFGARVFSHYGHYELAVLAGFCEEADTYHVLPQYGYAELLDPDGQPVTTPGTCGEIVATSFVNRATPFIRYRTGDLAVLEGVGCARCGRPHQIWTRIEGRAQELAVTRTGRQVSMTALNMHDRIFDGIVQFRFVQGAPGDLTFEYVPRAPGRDPAIVAAMRAGLLAKLGDDVTLTMEAVGAILPAGRGKRHVLVRRGGGGDVDA